MKPIKFKPDERYEIILIDGKYFMFTNLRVDRESVPSGLYVYDIGDADSDGCIARVCRFVMVNHWGTIIGKDPIPDVENGDGYYPEYGTAEYEGCYGGDAVTLAEYLAGDYAEIDGSETDDCEISLKPGHEYLVTADGDISDIEELLELIKDNLQLDGVEVCSSDTENGVIRLHVTTKDVIRTMQVKDDIMYAFEELELDFRDAQVEAAE